MLKNLTYFILLLLFQNISAQDIEMEKNVIMIEGKAWLQHEGCKGLNNACTLYDNNKEELIYIKYITVEGVVPATSGNPKGNLNYVEVKFLGTNKVIELESNTRKQIIKTIYNSKVINEDLTINIEKLNRLVEKYGTPYSDRLNNKPNTIIIKQENSSNDKKGIDIKIGI